MDDQDSAVVDSAFAVDMARLTCAFFLSIADCAVVSRFLSFRSWISS